jgi:hypothetical protein
MFNFRMVTGKMRTFSSEIERTFCSPQTGNGPMCLGPSQQTAANQLVVCVTVLRMPGGHRWLPQERMAVFCA